MPASAYTYTYGTVDCTYGNNDVVGVWVKVRNGKSGWANHHPRPSSDYHSYSYYEIDAGKTYQLHVGCGGTPQNWAATFVTTYVTGYKDWACSVFNYSYSCVES